MTLKSVFVSNAPIIVVDEDPDDRQLHQQIIEELQLPKEPMLFELAATALVYLRTTSKQPVIIVLDLTCWPLLD